MLGWGTDFFVGFLTLLVKKKERRGRRVFVVIFEVFALG
jgi:hypothetical protein